MSFAIDTNKLPDSELYIHSLASDIQDLDEFSPGEIMERFIMGLYDRTDSLFMTCQLPYQRVGELIGEASTLLIHATTPDEDIVSDSVLDEARRIEIAREIFPVIVAAMLPHAIQQDGVKDAQAFYRTTFTYEVLSEEPLGDLTLSDIEKFCDDGPGSGRWIEVKEEQIDGQTAANLLYDHGSEPGFFQLNDKGENKDEDEEPDKDEEDIVLESFTPVQE